LKKAVAKNKLNVTKEVIGGIKNHQANTRTYYIKWIVHFEINV